MNSPLPMPGENNLLPSQTINNDQSEEASAGVATTSSLLSLLKNNPICMSLSQNSAKMKCYFHLKQNCFLGYFKEPVLDGAVIYVGDVPFQYIKRECMYTEFIGNPNVASKRYHEFLLN